MDTIRKRAPLDVGAIPYPRTDPDLAKAINGRILAGISAVFAVLCAWQERALIRHRMRTLDDRILDDIGLSRAEVEREAEKPFWVA